MAACTEIIVKFERRRAIYKPFHGRPEYGIARGEGVECRVWGCFQSNDGDAQNPYFVIELADGRCLYASPEYIQFIKEDDEC